MRKGVSMIGKMVRLPDMVILPLVATVRRACAVPTGATVVMIPPLTTPLGGFYLSTMAQVYPEDRGTNYAIREGRRAARAVAGALQGHRPQTPRPIRHSSDLLPSRPGPSMRAMRLSPDPAR